MAGDVLALGDVVPDQAVGRSYVCQAARICPGGVELAGIRVADSMRRKSLRASARLRERRTSRWVLPSAVRLISYCCDSG